MVEQQKVDIAKEATVKRAAASHETKSNQEQSSKSENEQDNAAGVETEELKE